jgi:hypothetical protein
LKACGEGCQGIGFALRGIQESVGLADKHYVPLLWWNLRPSPTGLAGEKRPQSLLMQSDFDASKETVGRDGDLIGSLELVAGE